MDAHVVRRVAVLLVVLAAAARADAAPSMVAAVGEASPLGLPLSRLSDPALDDRGRIAFVGASTVLFRRTPAGVVHLLGAVNILRARIEREFG